MRARHFGVIAGTMSWLAIAGFVGCGGGEDTSGSGGEGGAATSSSSLSTVTVTSIASSSSTGMMVDSFVGQPCDADTDCGMPGENGRCLLPTDTVTELFVYEDAQRGGPANGYCTMDCMESPDCPADAACFNGICIEVCGWGSPTIQFINEEIPSDKCHGRLDVACYNGTIDGESVGLCVPNCGTDAECGPGRVCDPRAGFCVDTARTGLGLGEGPCQREDYETAEREDTCAGVCANVTIGEKDHFFCSQRCGFGGDFNLDQDCGGLLNGICRYYPTNTGVGDAAYCAGACSSHDECSFGDSVFCQNVADLYNDPNVGVGYCGPVRECPNGNECQLNGRICIQTAVGPHCLDEDPNNPGQPLIPLGAAAPGQGGAGGAGGAGGMSAGGAGGN